MQLIISDTNDLTAQDLRILHAVLNGEAAAPVTWFNPSVSAVVEDPETPETPEAEAPESSDGGEASRTAAVARATELVSAGDHAKVKGALASLGAKRVSEVKINDLGAFLAALD